MKRNTTFLLLFLFSSIALKGQEFEKEDYPSFTMHETNFVKTKDSSFYQMKYKWDQIIDEQWGEGDPLSTKQSIFNQFANRNEDAFPCFEDLDIDWDTLKSYPSTRFFGKPTNGAFSVQQNPIEIDGWFVTTPNIVTADIDAPEESMVGMEFPIDEPVWIEPESVAEGIDNIVAKAINWIKDSISNRNKLITKFQSTINIYPNPFNESTTISMQSEQGAEVSLKIFDTRGKEVASLLNNQTISTNYSVTGKPDNLPAGIYYCVLINNSGVETKEMVYIK